VLGIGIEEHFIASDVFALAPVTQTFVFLEEGDIAEVQRESFTIYDRMGSRVERPLSYAGQHGRRGRQERLPPFHAQGNLRAAGGGCRNAGRAHPSGPVAGGQLWAGSRAGAVRSNKGVHIIACGTSYHAGLVARYWLENLGVPCTVEVASEYRYRRGGDAAGTLFVSISQSGETADTLAALRAAKGARLSIHPGHLQCRGKFTGAGIGIDPADARRTGNRRGVHQGVHHPTGRCGCWRCDWVGGMA
jgi:glucosamine--fructose-6-phosphate aminotransferase (isomerizing)